jgi:hypothetical protein
VNHVICCHRPLREINVTLSGLESLLSLGDKLAICGHSDTFGNIPRISDFLLEN